MADTNQIHPGAFWGQRLDSNIINSLPYEALRVVLDCGHSFLYMVQPQEHGPVVCGLCLFKQGFEGELPGRLHLFKTLAENGKPQTAPMFMSHLKVIMGLKAPPRDVSLKQFKQSRARGHYSSPARTIFPVASALWELMGYQPPLGIVVVRAVGGRNEFEIAKELNDSVRSIHIRMAKGVRTALRFLPRVDREGTAEARAGRDDSQSSEQPRVN